MIDDKKQKKLAPLEEVVTTTPEMGMQIQQQEAIPVPSREDYQALPPLPQRTMQGGMLPSGELSIDKQQGTPPPALSPLEVQTNAYNRAVQSKPHKQGALAQGAWWALQGINKIFNPQDDTPVQWLGEAKRQNRIMKEGQKLAPLQAQDKFNRDREQQQTIIDINRIKPEIMQREAERKVAKDAQTAKYNELRLKVGQQKADDWRWAQEQLDAYRQGTLKISQEKLQQYQRVIDETERWHNIQDENTDNKNDTNREKGKPKNNVSLPPTGQLTPEQGNAVLKAIGKMPPAQQKQARDNFYKQNPHLAK